MSIGGLGSGSFLNPFGILYSGDSDNASADPTAVDTSTAADQTSTADTAATAAPAAPVPLAPSFTSLLDAVRQLTGSLNLPAPMSNDGGSAAASATASTATPSASLDVGQNLFNAISQATGAAPAPLAGSNGSSATSSVTNPPTTIQSRLHQLFQQLADATAGGATSDTSAGATAATASDGSGTQRTWGGHHHHHHRAGDGSAPQADGSSGGQNIGALLHEMVHLLAQHSASTGAAATTSAQTGASYDIVAQLKTSGMLLNDQAG